LEYTPRTIAGGSAMTLIKIAVSAECEYSPDENGTFYFVTQVDPILYLLRQQVAELTHVILQLNNELDAMSERNDKPKR
jgi:hypothetical protein